MIPHKEVTFPYDQQTTLEAASDAIEYIMTFIESHAPNEWLNETLFGGEIFLDDTFEDFVRRYKNCYFQSLLFWGEIKHKKTKTN